ncbi:DUF397 domain-containing protein [Saccharothrix coeruleofusca]|uniref:DUF397 domain-containing protein n=1 Tax=Saccharothrix coeruleofusca TaxID=33919 RepID=UPI00166F682B|nr:DUF397 domain-containing protein [Saccharothrix coeruleofusca]
MTQWRKSSRSSAQTNCVEVRRDLCAVRDSKSPEGSVLRFDNRAIVEFIAAVRRGRSGG